MFMNFKTRREAREYAAKFNIAAKEITNTKTGSFPWRVKRKETKFVADGRMYRLADKEGFVLGSPSANKIQAAQIEKHHSDGFSISHIDGRFAHMNAHPSLTYNKLELNEATFFVEVVPVKKPARKRKPKPVAVVDQHVNPDLDAELDSPAEPTVAHIKRTAVQNEKDPHIFVVGREYILVDKDAFISMVSGESNKIIADTIDKTAGGVYKIKSNRSDIAWLDLSEEGVELISGRGVDHILTVRERKFFREVEELGGLVAGERATVAVVSTADAHSRQYDELTTELESAMQEHQTALNSVVSASRKVHDIAIKLAALKK